MVSERDQDSIIVSANQTPLISYHGRVLPFFGYMGNQDEVAQFGPRGVHITNNEIPLGWVGPERSDLSVVDEAVAHILSADPEALLVPRIMLEPGDWWCTIHYDELCRMEDGELGGPGGRLAGVSLASTVWREEASEAMARFLDHVLSSPYADHFVGVLWCAGSSAEWGHYRTPHWPELLFDHSPAMQQAFQAWLRRTYGDTERLSLAWGQDITDFSLVQIPSQAERLHADLGPFLDPGSGGGRRALDLHSFANSIVAEQICHFAAVHRRTAGRRLLCGFFYGYVLNFMTREGRESGRLAAGQLLDNPDIDFFAVPNLYDRRFGKATLSMTADASVRAHGKLFVHETDTRTHRASLGNELFGRTASPQETEAMILKDFGPPLTHGNGLWWGPAFEPGWFADESVLSLLSQLRALYDDEAARWALLPDGAGPVSAAEVALIVDETSELYHGSDRYFYRQDFSYADIVRPWDTLFQIGAPVDVYYQSDLNKVGLSRYRLVVFQNPWYVTDEQRCGIDALKDDDRVLLWHYAAGLLRPEGIWPQGMEALTDITLKMDTKAVPAFARLQGDSWLVQDLVPDFRQMAGNHPARYIGWDRYIAPQIYGADATARVLARFVLDDRPAYCLKEMPRWKSLWLGVPECPAALYRRAAELAGVHIYDDADDVVYASDRYLVIHTKWGGHRTIRLRQPMLVEDALSGAWVVDLRKSGDPKPSFEVTLPEKCTVIYRLTVV